MTNISGSNKEKTNTRDIKEVDNLAEGKWLVEEREGQERFWHVSQVLVPWNELKLGSGSN